MEALPHPGQLGDLLRENMGPYSFWPGTKNYTPQETKTSGGWQVSRFEGFKVGRLTLYQLTFRRDTREARTVRAAVSSKREGHRVLGGLDRTYCRDSFPPLWAVPLGLEGSWNRSRDRQAAFSGGAGIERPAPLQRERLYFNPGQRPASRRPISVSLKTGTTSHK